MIKGIGIDIVGLERFKEIERDKNFINEILTPREISTFRSNERNGSQIALKFALKEALMKSLGWGLTYGSYWHDIEVSDDGQINLTNVLKVQAEKIKVTKIHSSYSYSKNYLTAFVLLEG
ncbi:MAG: holo-[acyl-carrier-protein] synthase [Chlorobiaceae bacterium]|nr:holo-[acyl-carrier-protein] synthase [Chlorobiaceae bacterium]